jgi:hypothetical protein
MDDKRIDDDWKRRASEEKAKIAAELGKEVSSSSEEDGPNASDPLFPAVIQQIAYPALMALGQIPDPRTGERMLDLNLAKETIDLLAVLEKKTVGNRSAEEDKMLRDLLRDLQMAYSQSVQLARKTAEESTSENPTE